MHHLIFGIIIQVSSERRVLGLESEALGSILTGGNIFLLIFFCFHVVKPLVLILALQVGNG